MIGSGGRPLVGVTRCGQRNEAQDFDNSVVDDANGLSTKLRLDDGLAADHAAACSVSGSSGSTFATSSEVSATP